MKIRPPFSPCMERRRFGLGFAPDSLDCCRCALLLILSKRFRSARVKPPNALDGSEGVLTHEESRAARAKFSIGSFARRLRTALSPPPPEGLLALLRILGRSVCDREFARHATSSVHVCASFSHWHWFVFSKLQ